MPPRVCVIGSANIDLTFQTARFPQPGETLAGHGFHQGFGGKGANQAVMAARLGAEVSLIAAVGRDGFGEQYLSNLRAEGIDCDHVRIDPQRPTGVASIVVDDAARNYILIFAGANAGLSPEKVRDAAGPIRTADVVLCQLEVPVETSEEALRIARGAGVRTILNPAPGHALPDEFLSLADLCVPNETELATLTGRPVATRAEALSAGRDLLRRGPKAVLVTLGREGAILIEAETSLHVPGHAVRAVDTAGAGDAFIGALAALWGQGQALADAIRRATALAALSVTRPGTQASFPRMEEAYAFLRERGLE